MSKDIKIERDGFVAVITLDRPHKLNAVTADMADALMASAEELNADDAIRCVILTGAGDRAFCAGSDIGGLGDSTTPWNFRNRPHYSDAVRLLRKPAIAAINGYAFGGGLEIALACDIRIASETATFAAPEIKLGWIGGGGMVASLAESIGQSNAAVMLMTGDPIDVATAERWGLVSRVVAREALIDTAQELALTIASRAPIAAETAKINLRATIGMSYENAIAYERDLGTICFATEDAEEGRRAFAEKRPAVFKRR